MKSCSGSSGTAGCPPSETARLGPARTGSVSSRRTPRRSSSTSRSTRYAVDARRDGRRVVFFCACETPRRCYRRSGGHLVLRAVRRRGSGRRRFGMARRCSAAGSGSRHARRSARLRRDPSALRSGCRRPGRCRSPRSVRFVPGSVARLRARGPPAGALRDRERAVAKRALVRGGALRRSGGRRLGRHRGGTHRPRDASLGCPLPATSALIGCLTCGKRSRIAKVLTLPAST